MGLKHQQVHIRNYKLLPVDDKPLHFDVVPESKTCVERFPECPEIRCQRPIHIGPESGACYASSRDPYYSVFWEKR